MSQSQEILSLKRKRQESSLPEAERLILNVIRKRENMAIWTKDIRSESKLSDNIVNRALKNLKDLQLIKEVPHIQHKTRKHYIAAEFEPSKDVTGGSWYVNGNLDKEFINILKDLSLKIIRKLKVATTEGVFDFFKKNKVTTVEFTSQQISEILRSMVLDNEIIEVKSTGLGEYHSIPIGTVCYRCPTAGGGLGQGPITGAMATIPCGICPRINQCTPDGVISPSTCVYFTKWLDF